jgi:hypothetical protein
MVEKRLHAAQLQSWVVALVVDRSAAPRLARLTALAGSAVAP